MNLDMAFRAKSGNGTPQKAPVSKKKPAVTCDSDIEPDDLIPAYLETKTKLFEADRGHSKENKKSAAPGPEDGTEDKKFARLNAKLERIEKDVLFDRIAAEQQWKSKKISLEKDLAAAKKQRAREAAAEVEADDQKSQPPTKTDMTPDDEVNNEAERIAAEILAQSGDDDGDALADLFGNLPTNEVDATTGKTNTVVNGADGVKIVVRDFGKWTGVSPLRTLEEACRARSVPNPSRFILSSSNMPTGIHP